MELNPDHLMLWQWGVVHLNATLLYTWLVMAILVVGARLITRGLSAETRISRWQNLLEVIVLTTRKQVREISQSEASERYLPFVGTLFLFISVANLLALVPGYHPPTASLSTTAALACCVFVAVPLYGILEQGVGHYLRHYLQPTPLMLPFHVIGELTRTLALAVRLFGNVMSGTTVGAIMLGIAPLFFPILLQALELLIGQVQAYIFAVLATVYIASAAHAVEAGTPTTGEHHG